MALKPTHAVQNDTDRERPGVPGRVNLAVAGRVTGRATGPGTLFGVPFGDLGLLASLLMGAATGFAAFFAATFVGIVGIMIYNSNSQNKIDYSYSYMRLGVPVGALVLVVALGYLGMLWVRRIMRRG